jgi:5-methylcytosine-specific restriction endonuclease McrA
MPWPEGTPHAPETIVKMKAVVHKRGWHHTAEAKQKIKLKRLEREASKPPKIKPSPKPHSGWKWTDEQRRNASEAHKGLRFSESGRAKLSASRKRAWRSLSPEEKEKHLAAWRNKNTEGYLKPPSRRRPSGNCSKCGAWRQSLHREHIIPKFKGGSEDPSNIQYICANCHEDKTREDLRGMPSANKGKKFSDEHKKKLRIAAIKRSTGNKQPYEGVADARADAVPNYCHEDLCR